MDLIELIESYNSKEANDLDQKQLFLYTQNESDFWIDLRDFGKVKLNGKWVISSHFKNNIWYNMKQKALDGKEVQLRDELIKMFKERKILKDKRIKTFKHIYKNIEEITFELRNKGIIGASQMTNYDLSLYIGSRKKIYPKDVFIHRGVKDGAMLLGIINNKGKNYILKKTEVIKKCPLLQNLGDSKHIENFLCIYKHQLKNIE